MIIKKKYNEHTNSMFVFYLLGRTVYELRDRNDKRLQTTMII